MQNQKKEEEKGTRLGSGRSGVWPLSEIHFMSSRTSGSLFVKRGIGLDDLQLSNKHYHSTALKRHGNSMNGLK